MVDMAHVQIEFLVYEPSKKFDSNSARLLEHALILQYLHRRPGTHSNAYF